MNKWDGMLCLRAITRMSSDPPKHPSELKTDADYWLVLAWLAYAVVNVLAVSLACGGIIHPPWATYTFFSTIGPGAMTGTVLLLHFTAVRFHAAVLAGFLVIMVVTALLNILMFGQATAAV